MFYIQLFTDLVGRWVAILAEDAQFVTSYGGESGKATNLAFGSGASVDEALNTLVASLVQRFPEFCPDGGTMHVRVHALYRISELPVDKQAIVIPVGDQWPEWTLMLWETHLDRIYQQWVKTNTERPIGRGRIKFILDY